MNDEQPAEKTEAQSEAVSETVQEGQTALRTQQTYVIYTSLVGLAVAVINLAVFFIYSRGVHKRNVKKAIAMKKEKEKIKNEA